MAYGRAIICRFDTVSDLRGKDRTYTNIKAHMKLYISYPPVATTAQVPEVA